jgi:hypothetical protein
MEHRAPEQVALGEVTPQAARASRLAVSSTPSATTRRPMA